MANKIICLTINLLKWTKIILLIEFFLYTFALMQMLFSLQENYAQFLTDLKFTLFLKLKKPIIIILIFYKLNLVLEYYGIQVRNLTLLNFSCFFRLLQTISMVGLVVTVLIRYAKGQMKYDKDE